MTQIGGYTAWTVTLHVQDDAATREEAFADCDQNAFASYEVDDGTGQQRRDHQGPGQVDELWILDVDGVLVIIDTAYYAGTPAEHVEELRAIVESATFE